MSGISDIETAWLIHASLKSRYALRLPALRRSYSRPCRAASACLPRTEALASTRRALGRWLYPDKGAEDFIVPLNQAQTMAHVRSSAMGGTATWLVPEGWNPMGFRGRRKMPLRAVREQEMWWREGMQQCEEAGVASSS